MDAEEVAELARRLPGVRASRRQGCTDWRYHGRIVARLIDDTHLVIRAEFDYRDDIVRHYPDTFSVPRHYLKHMMLWPT